MLNFKNYKIKIIVICNFRCFKILEFYIGHEKIEFLLKKPIEFFYLCRTCEKVVIWGSLKFLRRTLMLFSQLVSKTTNPIMTLISISPFCSSWVHLRGEMYSAYT